MHRKSIFRVFLLAAFFILIFACVENKNPTKISKGKRLYFNGFSILPPEIENLELIEKTKTEIIFQNSDRSKQEYFEARASVSHLTKDLSDEQFFEDYKRAFDPSACPKNLTLITNEILKSNEKKTFGIKHHHKGIKDAPPSITIENLILICRHPQRPKYIVTFEVHQYSFSPDMSEEFIEIAKSFIDNAKIEKLR